MKSIIRQKKITFCRAFFDVFNPTVYGPIDIGKRERLPLLDIPKDTPAAFNATDDQHNQKGNYSPGLRRKTFEESSGWRFWSRACAFGFR